MKTADLPPAETFRLLDLYSYKIAGTLPENDFDELVELAAQICDCPVSLITLLDKDKQWFKSKKGVTMDNTPRDISFCSHAILQDDVMIVEDTAIDNRFFDNPLVTGDTNVRFYAGAPIVSPAGYKLGTVCVIDTVPRKLTEKETRALVILSNQVTKLLELRKTNLAISEQAAETMKIRNRVVGDIIRQSEEDKKLIAYALHEDLAQRIASSLFYLQAATATGDRFGPMLQTATVQLRDLLANVQELSHSISPLTLDLLPARELVGDYIERMKAAFHFLITTNYVDNNEDGSDNETVIAMIRITMQWLQALAKKQQVSKVFIEFRPAGNFTCTITDNGPVHNTSGFEQEIINSLVYERTAAQNGTIEWFSVPGKNTIKIQLPAAVLKKTSKVNPGSKKSRALN